MSSCGSSSRGNTLPVSPQHRTIDLPDLGPDVFTSSPPLSVLSSPLRLVPSSHPSITSSPLPSLPSSHPSITSSPLPPLPPSPSLHPSITSSPLRSLQESISAASESVESDVATPTTVDQFGSLLPSSAYTLLRLDMRREPGQHSTQTRSPSIATTGQKTKNGSFLSFFFVSKDSSSVRPIVNSSHLSDFFSPPKLLPSLSKSHGTAKARCSRWVVTFCREALAL